MIWREYWALFPAESRSGLAFVSSRLIFVGWSLFDLGADLMSLPRDPGENIPLQNFDPTPKFRCLTTLFPAVSSVRPDDLSMLTNAPPAFGFGVRFYTIWFSMTYHFSTCPSFSMHAFALLAILHHCSSRLTHLFSPTSYFCTCPSFSTHAFAFVAILHHCVSRLTNFARANVAILPSFVRIRCVAPCRIMTARIAAVIVRDP